MIKTISTGSILLDQALGIGGVPLGWITEISGPSESGKTTICQHILGQAQKMMGRCVFIDADHSFNPLYAKQCGVNLSDLYIIDPETAEQAIESAYILLLSGTFTTIVIDSINCLVPQSEYYATLGSQPPNVIDGLVSRWLPLITAALRNSQTALIVTSQSHTKMSGIYHELESNLTRLAILNTAALRFKLYVKSGLNRSDSVLPLLVQIVKNKFYPCLNRVELDIIVNRGINKTGELYDLGLLTGVLSKKGDYYFYLFENLGRTREEVCEHLYKHPDLGVEVERVVRQRITI